MTDVLNDDLENTRLIRTVYVARTQNGRLWVEEQDRRTFEQQCKLHPFPETLIRGKIEVFQVLHYKESPL